MADTIRIFSETITVSAGSGNTALSANKYNSIIRAGGFLEQLLVSAPNSNVVFDFYIKDGDGFIVWDRTGNKEKINDTTRIPMRGTYTLYVENSDADGDFSVKLMFGELW